MTSFQHDLMDKCSFLAMIAKLCMVSPEIHKAFETEDSGDTNRYTVWLSKIDVAMLCKSRCGGLSGPGLR